MLKSIFTRENSHPGSGDTKSGLHSQGLGSSFGRLNPSQSAASLTKNSVPTGPVRITDQVIEEVDEQLTITSLPRASAEKIHVKSIFPDSKSSSSEAVDVPLGESDAHRKLCETCKSFCIYTSRDFSFFQEQ